MREQDPKIQRIELVDLDIAYLDAGPSEAVRDVDASYVSNSACGPKPPLLLLHGAVQSASIWERQVAAFSADRRVLAPDLRGHGATKGPCVGLTIEGLAGDQVAFMDALGVERAVVCGVSLGGMVALEMAVTYPDRVAALVLADTPLALSLRPAIRAMLRFVGPQRILPGAFAAFGQRRSARIGLAVARLLCGKGWVGPNAEHAFLEGFAAMAPDAVVATYRAIVVAGPPPVRRLAMPCLAIVGRRDVSLVLEHAQILARRVADARVVPLDAGHVANLDDPEGFDAALDAFLTSGVDRQWRANEVRRSGSRLRER